MIICLFVPIWAFVHGYSYMDIPGCNHIRAMRQHERTNQSISRSVIIVKLLFTSPTLCPRKPRPATSSGALTLRLLRAGWKRARTNIEQSCRRLGRPSSWPFGLAQRRYAQPRQCPTAMLSQAMAPLSSSSRPRRSHRCPAAAPAP